MKPCPCGTVAVAQLPIRVPKISGKPSSRGEGERLREASEPCRAGVFLADLVAQSLQLARVDLGSNHFVVRQHFEIANSMNSPLEAQHDFLSHGFHLSRKESACRRPDTFVVLVDVISHQ